MGTPLDPHQLTPSQLLYGIAPKRDPRVVYAPDVILMEEGDKAIKMAASDGMTWVFDAAAPHVNELQEGKIVFATGRAVGRIGQITRAGGTVSVKLAPVQITEVIHQGHFLIDEQLQTAGPDRLYRAGLPVCPRSERPALGQAHGGVER